MVNTTVMDRVILFPRKKKLRSISEISYIFYKKKVRFRVSKFNALTIGPQG